MDYFLIALSIVFTLPTIKGVAKSKITHIAKKKIDFLGDGLFMYIESINDICLSSILIHLSFYNILKYLSIFNYLSIYLSLPIYISLSLSI